jgi:hypothetical protein
MRVSFLPVWRGSPQMCQAPSVGKAARASHKVLLRDVGFLLSVWESHGPRSQSLKPMSEIPIPGSSLGYFVPCKLSGSPPEVPQEAAGRAFTLSL